MRWKHGVVGLALMIASALGCKQQCWLQECDYEHYKQYGLPHLECDPNASVEPGTAAIAAPTTVLDLERPMRYLSLAEAISMALESGTTGNQTPVNPGFANDNLITFGGRTVLGSDSIRAFSLDPAIIGADIEASLAKFDAQWNTSMTWNATDVPPQGLNQFNTGTTATFNTSLLKPLPTGGVAGITFTTQYQKLNNPPAFNVPILNPSYTPTLQFQFEQPLLQGYGIEINQLRASHPGSVLTPFPTGGRVEGILITRLRFDQARAEFQRDVHFMLYNVEVAYWNLYGAYWDLYAQEAALRQSFEAWRINKARYEAGRISIQDFAQTRQQYEQFRGNRLSAVGAVLENERQLRGLLGLPGEDGMRIVPADSPTLTPYHPDWDSAVNEALALRPELILSREDLKFRQLDLINTKNLMLPDLRVVSTYDINGLGSRLDGSDGNAFRSLASDQFASWQVGLRLSYVLGYRDAHAQTRQARLNLARSYTVLRDQERKAMLYLQQQYRHLFEFHEQIQIQRSQREAAAIQLQARFAEFLAGRGTLDILLESQRVWTAALQAEFDSIVRYNNALAGWEFAKGTIMQHDNVIISEGPLPQCAQVRAVEHLRERTKALVVRERANPVPTPPCDYEKGCPGLPELPRDDAPPIPSVWEGRAPVPDIHDPMPGIKPMDAKTTKANDPMGLLSPAATGKAMDLNAPGKLPSGIQPAPVGTYTGSPRSDASQTLPPVLPGADKMLPPLPAFPLPDNSPGRK